MIVELELKDLVVPQGLLPRVLTGTVEEKVEEYKEAMEQGAEFDPITVWKRPDGQYWIVDGVHRVEASKRLGRATIKAKLVELRDELEYRIKAIELNLKHGLPLQKEEKVVLTQTLYKLGVSIPELRKLFGVAERTLYYWLEPVKEKEKEELKKKALELRKKGLTQEEVAKQLGVSERTIYNWEREGMEEPEKIAKIAKISGSQLLSSDGTPTEWGYRALSEFIEENEQALKERTYNEVVKDGTLRAILEYLNEAVKKDFKKLIDADNYEKVKNYLMGMPPYKELSIRARRTFFDKVKDLWERLKKEYEEEQKLEREVLEVAKKVLTNPEYVFHTWRSVREDLARIGGMGFVFVYENREKIEEILRRHADELMEIYKQIPEATPDALSKEDLKEIKEKVKNEDKWGRLTRIREEVMRKIVEKGLRPVNAVVEEFVKRVEELLKEDKPTIDLSNWEEAVEEIEKSITDEQWEDAIRYKEKLEKEMQELKKVKAKEKEKKETTLPPSIEDWYRNELEELLLKMGLALGWPRAFEIVEEVLQKVKEYSKTAKRGW